MQVDLEAAEIESLIEALDCLKTKVAFVKGASYAERTERLMKADELEQKLRAALPAQP